VYLLFRARLIDPDVSPGAETLEVGLFSESEIPWEHIAFASVRNALVHYYEDRKRGAYDFHMGTIEPASAKR
jgi:hypothetical protein